MVESLECHGAPSAARGGDRPDVVTLVHAFDTALRTADHMPQAVVVPSTHRRHGLPRIVHSLPRPTPFLAFFVADHARTTLDRVRRRLLAAEAIGVATEDEQRELRSVTTYVESLPIFRRVLYSTTVLLLAIVLTRAVLSFVGSVEVFGAMPGQLMAIDDLLIAFQEAAANPLSLDGLVVTVLKAPEVVAFVLTSLSTALYVLLRPLVPAFRLKRTMFNLYPEPGQLYATPARSTVQTATGLYDLERAVLQRIGVRPRREVPFDLIVPALLLPAVLFFAALALVEGLVSLKLRDELLYYTAAAAAGTGVVARLSWLARVWRRRSSADQVHRLPLEARIRRSDVVVVVRDPRTIFFGTAVGGLVCLGVALASTTGDPRAVFDSMRFLALMFVIAPLWYLINCDVSAYLQVRGDPRPGRPLLALLAMAVGWIAAPVVTVVTAAIVAASVYDTSARVRRVQEIAGNCEHTLLHPALLVPAFIAFPWALAHIQRALNAAWRSDGELLR